MAAEVNTVVSFASKRYYYKRSVEPRRKVSIGLGGKGVSETRKEAKKARSLASIRTLVIATLATAAGMFIFEFAKEGLFSSLSKWQSHIVTICVTSLFSMAITALVLMRREDYAKKITHENARLSDANERINALLGEKNLLLKEVHHRIKNNLSVVHSLLRLQAGNASDSFAAEAIADAANRVQGMMQLYDKLYLSENFTSISVADYLPPLVDEIVAIFPCGKNVKIEKKIDDFLLPVMTIAPLGLIVNELITNAMKYAFIGRAGGTLRVSAESDGAKAFVAVEDDGNGIPESIDAEHGSGFGLTLIQMQTKQIGGSLSIRRGEGTMIFVEFDLER
jgi:two-component sensor histidine kinase